MTDHIYMETPPIQPTVPTSSVPTDIPLAESFRTKLIALWFVVSTLLSALVALAAIIIAALTLSSGSLPDTMMLLTLGMYASIIVTFVYLALVSYKISSGIHRLEIPAYGSAQLLILFNIAGSIIGIAIALFMKAGNLSLIPSLVSIAINGVLLYILRSERTLFIREGSTLLWKMTVGAVVLLVIMTLGSVGIQWKMKQQAEADLKAFSKELADRAAAERARINAEPTVTEWTRYKNDTFMFEMEIPEGWDVREYPPFKGTDDLSYIIALNGKGMLPADRYSIVDRSHTFITVYPVTDTKHYQFFQMRMSQIGRSGYKAAVLGGVQGVDNGLDIAVEHKGFVYEFTDKHLLNKNDEYVPSPISERMRSTFVFTEPVQTPVATTSADMKQTVDSSASAQVQITQAP